MSKLPLKLLMPWPPSINSLYCQGKTHGQKFLTKAGKLYKERIVYLYANDNLDPINVPIKVRIELFPPNTGRRDVDNYVKPLLDGLKYLELIEDDSLITTLLVIKHTKVPEYNKGFALVYLKEDTRPIKDRSKTIKDFFDTASFDNEDLLMFHVPTKKELKKKERGDK